MNSALKQRLVGAVVLVALAVIFLPMLLDGSGAEKRLDEQVAIPEKPEQPVSRFDQPIDESDATGDTQATASQTKDAASDAMSASTAEPSAPESASEPESTAESSSATRSDDAADTSANETGQTRDRDTDSAENTDDDSGNISAPDNDVTEGWIVQVGSFHRQTNALVMRDKLRKADFDANAESVQGDNGTLWRVLLGPVANKEQGQALKQRFEQKQGSDALLRSYP